jgi:hypothetical protein
LFVLQIFCALLIISLFQVRSSRFLARQLLVLFKKIILPTSCAAFLIWIYLGLIGSPL